MAGYIGPVPTPQATQTRDYFTATAGQTSFPTSGYTPGYLDVYLNGVHLQDSDFTATDGTDVVLNDPCAADDVVLVVAWTTFEAMNVDYANVQNKPTAVSSFTNDANYATQAYVDTAESDAVTTANAYTDTEIANLDALPSQTGNSGKYLTTDGSAASWADIPDEIYKATSDPTVTSNQPLGTVWVNTTSGEMFICTNATANQNTWTNVGEGSGSVAYIPPVSATGGSTFTAGGYKYHKFTSSSTFQVTAGAGGTVEYLIVAGGGGGGFDGGGGGGAGGLLNGSASVAVQSYSIIVGGGGSGASGYDVTPGNGGNSSALGVTAIGGGGASRVNYSGYVPQTASSGGSGGGGMTTNNGQWSYGGSGTVGQGHDGGDARNDAQWDGAGGGGAGEAGYSPGTNAGGLGGDGLQFSAWASATSSGDNGYFAGGGGGANEGGSSPGQGGLGGGGTGGSQNAGLTAQNGTSNTGGGGGGGENPGASGGSGIVLLRYAI